MIKWTFVKDIPNNQFRHIVLANNEVNPNPNPSPSPSPSPSPNPNPNPSPNPAPK